MSAATYGPTKVDLAIARTSLSANAVRMGLELDHRLRNFIEHVAQVQATDAAAIRYYTNALSPKE